MLQKPASAIATEKMMGIDGPDVRHFKNLEEVQAAIDDGSITWVECTAAHTELGVVFSFGVIGEDFELVVCTIVSGAQDECVLIAIGHPYAHATLPTCYLLIKIVIGVSRVIFQPLGIERDVLGYCGRKIVCFGACCIRVPPAEGVPLCCRRGGSTNLIANCYIRYVCNSITMPL